MKRISVFCVMALLTLALMGYGFAKWSDGLAANLSAKTGSLKWGLVGAPKMVDTGVDYHSEMSGGMTTVEPDPEGKDVGSTEVAYIDTDNDGVKDTASVSVKNAYPCYYNEVTVDVMNLGSIPVIIQEPVLHWGASSQAIDEEDTGTVYYLSVDAGGNPAEIIPSGHDGDFNPLPPPEGKTCVLEVSFQDNVGAQVHPGKKTGESFEVHVLQPAAQNHTYSFSFSINAVQWNESSFGPWGGTPSTGN